MASNLPPGCRESDIPGYNDVDCPLCGGTGVNPDPDDVDTDEDDDIDPDDCPECEGTGSVDSSSIEWDY